MNQTRTEQKPLVTSVKPFYQVPNEEEFNIYINFQINILYNF